MFVESWIELNPQKRLAQVLVLVQVLVQSLGFLV
jgi:hypothetical protein